MILYLPEGLARRTSSAKRAGALAGWCARLELKPGDVFLPAAVTGESLVEVADRLLTLH